MCNRAFTWAPWLMECVCAAVWCMGPWMVKNGL